jgi:hypothetical protein
MAIKTFTTGEVLTASDTNTYLANAGLVFIAQTTFTTTANPFINGCFSSTYQNYLVQIATVGSVATEPLYYRMRSGTNTPETGSVYDRYGFYWSTSGVDLVNANLVAAYIGDVGNAANSNLVSALTFYRPNQAEHTVSNSQSWSNASGAVYFPTHRIETTTVYTGIEITTLGSSTLTGTMRVYGYRQA